MDFSKCGRRLKICGTMHWMNKVIQWHTQAILVSRYTCIVAYSRHWFTLRLGAGSYVIALWNLTHFACMIAFILFYFLFLQKNPSTFLWRKLFIEVIVPLLSIWIDNKNVLFFYARGCGFLYVHVHIHIIQFLYLQKSEIYILLYLQKSEINLNV